MKQTIDIRAIIKKDQKILLLKDAQSAEYQLPGGVLGFGVDPREFLQKIIQQKIGQTTQVMQLADVHSYVKGPQGQKLAITFLVSLGQGSAQSVADATKYVWKKLSDIQPNEIDDFTARLLQLKGKSDITDKSTQKQLQIDDNNTTNIHKDVIVYTDGGSRGNPGPSAAGFVILGGNNEELLFEGGKYLGITTNNQAEYQAVKLGLEKALELGARVVKFRMDSLLIVNQMLGLYQIKNRDLWPIYASIKELTKKFDTVTFSHVRREFNKEADALVNKVLDEQVSGN